MKTFHQIPRRCGFTVPELVATVAIIGILTSIAVASYAGLHGMAREGVARDSLALLNRAVLHFNQTCWEIPTAANNGSASDELIVLRALQWRDSRPDEAAPGSSYISMQFNDATSSSRDDYRIRWNGHAFELLAPGTTGVGLKTGTMQAESPSNYTFPEGYSPPAP